jgi:AcrR family transcriptional regulator
MSSEELPKPANGLPRRLSPEASRSAALEAARILLIETGPQAVTLKAVATRIGRTHANLLHHFGSASGLQRDLAEYLTKAICVSIGEEVDRVKDGKTTPRQLADLIFDSFDRDGAGALASWMLLSGNEDALDPIVEAIHALVDDIALGGHANTELHKLTLQLVLMALGDAMMGGPLSASLGLERSAGREIAGKLLEQLYAQWKAEIGAE